MPRYFFHRMNGGFDCDNDGTVFESPTAARAAAIVFAGETIRDHPNKVWEGGEMRVEVTDKGGTLLTTVVIQSIDAMPLAELERKMKR